MKGAPKKPEHLKKIPVGIKIPAWMHQAVKDLAWLDQTTQNDIIETALIRYYGLKCPGSSNID